ncbi:MAG: HAD family hydrolase [Gaiellaceae bacterium MAG52_C11]|nr:HAD family hydrolase [Candidatus Gaiellasilicea maunaloa]
MAVRTVFFDVGETLVDETRAWGAAADAAGIPRLTFFGVLGGLAARGEQHRRVYEILGVPPGSSPDYVSDDFYPDAFPCLVELRRRGFRLGIAGNQPGAAESFLREAGLDVDWIGSSASWGVEKPSPEFFARILSTAGCDAAELAYVGDRVDNDVVPAADAGFVAVFLRRGPWGFLQAEWPEVSRAHVSLDSLVDLPQALADV